MAAANDRRPSWLHNMSVPARSTLTCARAALPGRRYLVNWLPPWIDGEAASRRNPAIEACIAAHGVAALAVLVAWGSADPPDVQSLGRLALRFRRRPGSVLSDYLTAALTGCGPSLPRRARLLARRFDGDAEACVKRAFDEALAGSEVPDRMGVFLPVGSSRAGAPGDRAPLQPLGSLASLAVLAHRCGPLYVPSRPIEPSLINLNSCVLVFHGTRAPET